MGEGGHRDRRVRPQLEGLRPRGTHACGRARLEAQAHQRPADERRAAGGLRAGRGKARCWRNSGSEGFAEARAHRRDDGRARADSPLLSRHDQHRPQLPSTRSPAGSAAPPRSDGCCRAGTARACREALEEKRHERTRSSARDFGERARNWLTLLHAVVGRQLHADQHDARACALARPATIAVRFSFICATGRPRRPSFAPSSTTTIAGLLRGERLARCAPRRPPRSRR